MKYLRKSMVLQMISHQTTAPHEHLFLHNGSLSSVARGVLHFRP